MRYTTAVYTRADGSAHEKEKEKVSQRLWPSFSPSRSTLSLRLMARPVALTRIDAEGGFVARPCGRTKSGWVERTVEEGFVQGASSSASFVRRSTGLRLIGGFARLGFAVCRRERFRVAGFKSSRCSCVDRVGGRWAMARLPSLIPLCSLGTRCLGRFFGQRRVGRSSKLFAGLFAWSVVGGSHVLCSYCAGTKLLLQWYCGTAVLRRLFMITHAILLRGLACFLFGRIY